MEANKGISEADLKELMFRSFYGEDFAEDELVKIIAFLRGNK